METTQNETTVQTPEWKFTREGFPWKTSEQTDKIIPAFFKALSVLEAAKKDAKNPFFNNSPYATLPNCLETINTAFDPNELVLCQPSSLTEDGKFVKGNTLIVHSSGQWMSHEFIFTVGKSENPQEVGKVTSYARRYDLGCVGLVTEVDDDANASSGNRTNTAPKPQATKPSAAMPKPVPQQQQTKPTNQTPTLAELVGQVAVAHNTQEKIISTVLEGVAEEPMESKIAFLQAMIKDKSIALIPKKLKQKGLTLAQALEVVSSLGEGGVKKWMESE